MRLIDDGAACDEIDEWLEQTGVIPKSTSYYYELMGCIEDTPTVDAVPVVRCKDCKYKGIDRQKGQFCNKHTSPSMWQDDLTSLRPDDFCSYGERKDGEEK